MEIDLLKKLRNRRGNALTIACVLVLCLLMLSGAIMEYARLTIIANGVRNALQASVISVSTQNLDETYMGLREGYSGGYSTENGEAWQEKLDYGDIYDELDKLLGLNSSHGKKTGEDIEYSLSGLEVKIGNAPFAPADPVNCSKFAADAKITLEAPLMFGQGVLPPMKITIKTSSEYTPKF